MGQRAGDCIFSVDSVLLGKPKGKRGPERPRHGWEDNINCFKSDSSK